jgi:hypothetical protein
VRQTLVLRRQSRTGCTNCLQREEDINAEIWEVTDLYAVIEYVAPSPFVNSDVVVNIALCCALVLLCECDKCCCTNSPRSDACGSSRASCSSSVHYTFMLARNVYTHYRINKYTRPQVLAQQIFNITTNDEIPRHSKQAVRRLRAVKSTSMVHSKQAVRRLRAVKSTSMVHSKQAVRRHSKQAVRRHSKQAVRRHSKQAVRRLRAVKSTSMVHSKQAVRRLRAVKSTSMVHSKQAVRRHSKQAVRRHSKQAVRRHSKQAVRRLRAVKSTNQWCARVSQHGQHTLQWALSRYRKH